MTSFIGVVFDSLCRILLLEGTTVVSVTMSLNSSMNVCFGVMANTGFMTARVCFNPSLLSLLSENSFPFYLSFLIPSAGFVGLLITTECGRFKVSPGEIAILPQGFRFSVNLPDGPSRGYVAEIFGTHFRLPDLGPIGISSFVPLKNLS